MINFKYRTWYKGLPPNRTKLEIPGWAGERNNDHGQPWHCKPFVDAATYGFEILYPYETEIRVRVENGVTKFLYASDEEWKNMPDRKPMANFAPNHFGFTSSIDIQTDPGCGIMILPHPRFYTDTTGSVPVPVHGLIESDMWPKIFFIAFRSPFKEHDYVFRKGEGIAQFIIVPKEVEYNFNRMTKEEEASRVKSEQAIHFHGNLIQTRQWQDKHNHGFDNKYKVLSQIAKKEGSEGVINYLSKLVDDKEAEKQKRVEEQRAKFVCRFVKPEKRKNATDLQR